MVLEISVGLRWKTHCSLTQSSELPWVPWAPENLHCWVGGSILHTTPQCRWPRGRNQSSPRGILAKGTSRKSTHIRTTHQYHSNERGSPEHIPTPM